MSWIPDRYRELRAALRGARVEPDLTEEFENHIQMRTEENIVSGMSPDDARRDAVRRFGDLDSYRRETRVIDERIVRDRRRTDSLDALRREMRSALRSLVRNPGFSLIALLTLSLGIGATTAIFTMLDRVALAPLPYTEPGRLVVLASPVPGVKADAVWGLSAAEFFYFKRQSRALESLGGWSSGKVTVSGNGSAERVPAAFVSASMMNVLQFRPVAGRMLIDEDNRPKAPSVAVLSYDYWQRRLGGDPQIVGKAIDISSRSVQIVGVLGRGQELPYERVGLWLPLELDIDAQPVNAHYLSAIGRLTPNATVEQASAELAGFTKRLPELFPTAYSDKFMTETRFSTRVTGLRDDLIGDLGKRLWILLGSVSLVMLIAFANVANLFLVRSEGRRREVAIRSALGAVRGHLAWHFLTESLTLTTVAGVCALALAYAGLKMMLALAPADLPRVGDVHLAWSSVAFTALVSLGAGVLFGVLPLTGGAGGGGDVMTLREGGRGMTSSRRQHLVRGVLVAAQTALALVLLVASALMLQSFRNLRGVRPGFVATGLLTARIDLPYARYQTYEKVERFQRDLLARAGAISGVTSAASGSDIPLDGYGGCAAIFAEGDAEQKSEEKGCVTTLTSTPGYFATLGIPVRGREPTWSDVESHSGAVVITKALATRLWPGKDPIGRGIRGNGSTPPFYRVVGVADDFRGIALDKPVIEGAFYPLMPIPGADLWSPPRSMSIVLRTTSPHPELLTASLRRVVSELDPNVPLGDVRTMETVVARSMTRLSFTMMLLGVAASMALVLSAVGIYGVISYIVGRRRGEIGIRVALGARSAQVGAMVVAQSVKLAAAGVVAGLLGSLAVTRVMRSVLFDVSPTDPLTLVSVSALMLLLAAVASYIPARRATRVSPVEALRSE